MRRLRHKAMLQRLVEARGEMGNPIEVWQEAGKPVACLAVDLSGREYREGQKEETEITATIQMRFCNVDAGMRAVCEGRVYDIVAVLDREGKGRWLELQCKVVA